MDGQFRMMVRITLTLPCEKAQLLKQKSVTSTSHFRHSYNTNYVCPTDATCSTDIIYKQVQLYITQVFTASLSK